MELAPKQPTRKGSPDTFTGDVWIDAVAAGEEPSRVRVNVVRFSPGARSAWHSHALGQTLYVTAGAGLVQTRGEAVVPIRAGDIVHTPGDEEHWHGATPDDFMTHLSITEGTGEGGRPEAHWGALVSDAEYLGHDHDHGHPHDHGHGEDRPAG
jgi:quercetin dioxygenase-like cupin family protein